MKAQVTHQFRHSIDFSVAARRREVSHDKRIARAKKALSPFDLFSRKPVWEVFLLNVKCLKVHEKMPSQRMHYRRSFPTLLLIIFNKTQPLSLAWQTLERQWRTATRDSREATNPLRRENETATHVASLLRYIGYSLVHHPRGIAVPPV